MPPGLYRFDYECETVIDWSGDSGSIRIHGEVWAAQAATPLHPGDRVRVANRDGLTLIVEPV
jgi:membrane protein implicated in regulation of membrane protease activity